MLSTFFVDSELLGTAFAIECLDFPQLSVYAASLAQEWTRSATLHKRVDAALKNLIVRGQCVRHNAFIFQPRGFLEVLYSSAEHAEPPRCRRIADILVRQWAKTKCTRPIDVYFAKHAAPRFVLDGPETRRISARLCISEYWVRDLFKAGVYKRPPLELLSPSEASLQICVPQVLPDSEVLVETAVFRNRAQKYTAAITMVPNAGARDATAIERFLTETLADWQTALNEYIILCPHLRGAPWTDFPEKVADLLRLLELGTGTGELPDEYEADRLYQLLTSMIDERGTQNET